MSNSVYENQILLIDGSNVLLRSAFALVDLQTSTGIPIGGVYGFIERLVHVVKEYFDHTTIVVWDGGRSKRRMELYPEYKGNRSKKDDNIISQFPVAEDIVSRLGIASVRILGVEADDTIAVLARRADKAIICSTDRDFLQLVSSKVSLLREMDADLVTSENLPEVLNKVYKVPYTSTQMLRLGYGLSGDPTDNVPGVRGVGHKTAFAMLTEYVKSGGDLSGNDHSGLRLICEHDKRKKWRAVHEGWESFQTSLRLTDLHRDDILTPEEVAQALHWIKVTNSAMDTNEVIGFFQIYELKEQLDKIGYIEHVMTSRCKRFELRRML